MKICYRRFPLATVSSSQRNLLYGICVPSTSTYTVARESKGIDLGFNMILIDRKILPPDISYVSVWPHMLETLLGTLL